MENELQVLGFKKVKTGCYRRPVGLNGVVEAVAVANGGFILEYTVFTFTVAMTHRPAGIINGLEGLVDVLHTKGLQVVGDVRNFLDAARGAISQ